MKKVINTATRTVEFTFEGLPPVLFDTSMVTAANRDYAMLHGFAARIGDNAALSKLAENGFVVTEARRREAVMELVDHYRSGSIEWSPKAKAKAAPQNPHIAAIAVKRGCSYEEAMEWFAAKLQAEMDADIAA